ncbi:MAG: hypothetical protein OXI51_10425 [Chloroflexota bacterium]|nr:hypothetical protein [Chloroflexota bacterium]
MTSNVEEGIPRSNSATVDLAYGIALSAYSSSLQQWESVHRRLDALLSFVTTVTIAAPVAAQAVLEDPDFTSPLIILAGALYVVIVFIALVARSFGAILQLSPQELHESWLDLDEDEFKAGVLDWSATHNSRSRVLVTRKNFAAHVMAALFVCEALLLVAWMVAAGDSA